MSELVRAIATSDKTSGVCTANIAGAETTIEVARDLSVVAGDAILVAKYGDRAQWVAVARLGVSAPPIVTIDPAPAPPPPKPVITTGSLVVSPVETRSYRSGKWRTDNDDVYQGQYGGNGNHTGCAFYGTKPRSLAGATVTRAVIKVRRLDAGGLNAAQNTTMRLVAERFRPADAPTLGSVDPGPSLRRGETDNSFDIDPSWAQAMVDGSAGGIGFFDGSGSPYVIFAGRGSWSAAFTLTIYWKRSG